MPDDTQFKSHQMQMRVDEQFLAAIDDWRAAERPVPSRSEAVRLLCYKAIEADKPKKGR
jgi:hypothetical protein